MNVENEAYNDDKQKKRKLQIDDILSQLPENEEAKQLLRKAFAIGDDVRTIEKIDTDAAYMRLKERIGIKHRRHILVTITRYAAILAIPLLIATLALAYMQLQRSDKDLADVRYVEIKSAAGLVVNYVLPDGTKVWLNSDSKLRFPSSFKGDKREVELSGEAYFSVTADKRHPFYVNTPEGMQVYVYGTKFDVSAYPDDNFIQTVLAEGHVNVIGANQHRMELTPGNGIRYDKATGRMRLAPVDVYELTAWKDGKLVFRDEPLENVLKKLSRHYDTEIVLNNPKGRRYNYRATFRNETLTQVLDYLSQATRRMGWHQETSDQPTGKKRVVVDLYKN